MYLPLFVGDGSRAGRSPGERPPLFYGAISLYLRQQSRFFRRLPAACDAFFNARPFLALAAGLAGSTRAAGLEEMTISMLEGEAGNQAAELERLCSWLEREAKPGVVHLAVLADHDIVDGAPLARFVRRFVTALEKAEGL